MNTSDHLRDGDPSWSPDGTTIALESSGGRSEVWVMHADRTALTQLTFNGPAEDRGTSWSPDGTQIAFHSAMFPPAEPGPGHSALDIFTMNADGSNVMPLTESDFQDSLPSVSPDDTKIAFRSNTLDPSNFDVYVMNADGTGITRLAFNESAVFDEHCDWGVLTPFNKDDCKGRGWQRSTAPTPSASRTRANA